MKRFRDIIIEYSLLIRIGIYLLVTIYFTQYVFRNWEEATTLTFFSQFNGINLVFVVWIGLLLVPIIGSFDGFGVKIAFWEQQKQEKQDQQEKLGELTQRLHEVFVEANKKDESKKIIRP